MFLYLAVFVASVFGPTPGVAAVLEHPDFLPPPVLVVADITQPTPTTAPLPAQTLRVGCPAAADDVEAAFQAAFATRPGCIVAVIRCEGWNQAGWAQAAAQGVPAWAGISPTDDVGPAQINWVHGRPGGIIDGRWPEAVQTVEGNIAAALELYDAGGWYPWKNSRHCHGQT